jgi:hypothetical protein
MRRRHLAGQSVNHIATAMGRSWDSVNRYIHGLTWIQTRNPRHPPEEHLRYFRERTRRRREHLRTLR